MKLKNKPGFCSSGFTLVEVLGVMLLISLFLVTLFPNVVKMTGDYKLEAAADKLASDISRAKMYAMTYDRIVRVVFDSTLSGDNYYYIYSYDFDIELEEDIFLPSGISLSSNLESFVFGGKQVSFNKDGIHSRGGTVTLTGENGESLYVIIASISGRVRVSSSPPSNSFF